MKRSWVIPALMIGSVASAVLLLFSFVNDFLQLLTHYSLVPVSFTGTLWNVIGLVPTPASLIGLLPYISSDPILTPHYRPFTFFFVQIVAACSLAVSAAGFMAAPVFLIAFLQPSSVAAVSAGVGSGLMTIAMLCLLFILGNFVLLLASLRTSGLAQSEATNSPLHWVLGFAFPFATLMARP